MEKSVVSGLTAGPDLAPQPLLLDVTAVALLLDISTRTVWRLASSGEAPRPIRFGGSCRWRRTDIDDWIARGCPACT